MALVTLCPGCGTTYKIYPEQLQAQDGLVRCGKCQVVFNGLSTLLTIDESEIEYLTTPADKDHIPTESEEGPTASEEIREQTENTLLSHNELQMNINVISSDSEHNEVNRYVKVENSLGYATSGKVAAASASDEPVSDFLSDILPEKSAYDWVWQAGSIVLFMVLIGQAVYAYRGELVTQMPKSRPYIERYCNVLGCSVPLPKDIEFFSIASSDFQVQGSDNQPQVGILTAIIRNHATYAQALPALKLFLTDVDDQLLASRIFTAADYLSETDRGKTEIQPDREIVIQLYLDNSAIKSTGYRLQILYI